MELFGAIETLDMAYRATLEHILDVAEFANRTTSEPDSDGVSLLGVTATLGSYPTVAGEVYVVTPLEIDADDAEGASASYTPDTSNNVYAINTGTAIPPIGTRVIVHAVAGRWVFTFNG